MRCISLSVVILLLLGGYANADGLQLMLELRELRDGKVVDRLSLYANEINPNVRSVNDRYRLEHNGRVVDVPETLLQRLNYQRRGYSYDSFTGGITRERRQAMCMMAGPAVGQILYVRYLTFRNHKISKSEMRPVLSDAGNCLFTEVIAPKNNSAEKEATRALASLQVAREFLVQ